MPHAYVDVHTGCHYYDEQSLLLLQDFITANYYPCTDEILAGLGRMYVADERFARNIDKNGAGAAEFASRAIAAYTGK